MTTSSWDNTFKSWLRPRYQERFRAKTAERLIRTAISKNRDLRDSVFVFAQGSYKNATNIADDSDVDICVLNRRKFFSDFVDEAQERQLTPGSAQPHEYKRFKAVVIQSLFDSFKFGVVTRGGKAIDVHENTYRIHADVVPCFEHRYYLEDGSYQLGTAFIPDSWPGALVSNFPFQNYQNGVTKNRLTRRRFKTVVRILKRLRGEMQEAGISSAYHVPSYFLECLVWNIPDDCFLKESLEQTVRGVVTGLRKQLGISYVPLLEINGIKPLFEKERSGHDKPWHQGHAQAFINSASNYLGSV